MTRQALVDMDLAVQEQDPRWQDLPLPGFAGNVEMLLTRALRAVFVAIEPPSDLAARGCEVSLVLTDDARIREMNRTWRRIDKATDVLSFPGDDGFVPPEEPVPLGDIVLARETIVRDAAALHRDLPHHLSHIAVHGLLHLLGWDHEEEAEARRMEAQERLILAQLGYVENHEEESGAGTAA